MKARWKKTVLALFMTLSFLGNGLAVCAEEQGEEFGFEGAEEIVINNFAMESQNEIRDVSNMEQELYVGEDFDINVNALADEANTDYNNARIIQVNSIVNDAITEEKQQRWYAFGANAGKLTLDLDMRKCSNVDYDVYLYQYDDNEGTITMIDGMAGNRNVEHFARMVDSGVYFVLVNGYSGYDAAQPYSLGVVLSTYYDEHEVDDRLQDAYVLSSMNYSVTGTIDNQFDVDIQQYSVTKAGRLYFTLRNNGSTGNIYAIELMDSYGNSLATLNQNKKYNVDLPEGIYFFKVFCSTYGSDYNSTYTLSGETRSGAARVEVTHAGDAPKPIQDYKDGPYWRVYSNSYVEGIAYDANGHIAPNADISIIVTVVNGNQDVYANGKTDSQGKFRIQLNIGDGVGEYTYYASGISRHYYDIVPVSFESNGKRISADIDHFYHFAYQIMIH